MDKVNILGVDYEIIKKNFDDDKEFKTRGINGYCDQILKEIVLCNMDTYPTSEKITPLRNELVEKLTLRHELLHAFLNESGLRESAGQPECGWSQNEEMIDWFAIQSPKIFKVFQELNIL